MLLSELVEEAFMSVQDHSADHRSLVARLLKTYKQALRQRQLSTSTLLATPSAAGSTSSSTSTIGFRNSLFTSPPVSSAQAYLKHSVSLTRVMRSESAYNMGIKMNESYSEGLTADRRSYSIIDHGRTCKS
jgi:hypothetical protein